MACSSGRYCGLYDTHGDLSFETCQEYARSGNAAGFSYRGTNSKWCRMCSSNDLSDIKYNTDWGVYAKAGMFILT